MKTTIGAVTSSEAATILRAKLGTFRAWSDFLSDNIRGRQHVHGLTLTPIARRLIGGAWRPMYSLDEVMRFVADVLAVEPAAGKKSIVPIPITIDTSKGWRENRT